MTQPYLPCLRKKKIKAVYKDMERIPNDYPAVALRKRYSRQKEQQENMSKEMKSVVRSENLKSSVYWTMWWALQSVKGMRDLKRPRNVKFEAWSQKTLGRAMMETGARQRC